MSHGVVKPSESCQFEKLKTYFCFQYFRLEKSRNAIQAAWFFYFLLYLPYLHVSATIYFMHVIQLPCIVSWCIVLMNLQGVLYFCIYFSHSMHYVFFASLYAMVFIVLTFCGIFPQLIYSYFFPFFCTGRLLFLCFVCLRSLHERFSHLEAADFGHPGLSRGALKILV